MENYTPHQARYFAEQIKLKRSETTIDGLASAMSGVKVDLNPHQVDAALFAMKSPLSNGALLADEVGLGKTIEGGLVLAQYWSERKRHILLIVPASYFLLKADNNPLIPYIVWLVCSFLFTIVTLMIAHIEIDLNIKKYFVQALFRPICIAFVVFPCTYWFISVLDTSPIRLIYTFFYTSFLSVILIMLFGLTRNEMKFIIKSIKNKIYGNIKKNS